MELRDYQSEAIDELRTALRTYHRVLFQLPTGGGKGVILGSIASQAFHKHTNVLIVSNRIEIVRQNFRQAERFGMMPMVISPKSRKVPDRGIAVGMAQTLHRRSDRSEWMEYMRSVRLLIIDEAHSSDMNFLFDLIDESCYVIGFTATPVRYGTQRQLGLDYEAIVTGPSVSRLIGLGYLCRCRLFSMDAPKLDNVSWDYSRGDYSLRQMSALFRSHARYLGAVQNYQKICEGRKTLVFCCSSEQTVELTKAFNEAGVRAKYLLSNSYDSDEGYSGERSTVLKEFERGDIDVLVNFGLFTTGLDIPSIEAVILMFSTASLTKYLQCLGRASRPTEVKREFLCLDFGGNYERLGRYEDEREWSVWHKVGAGGGIPPVKECPVCHRFVPVQTLDCPFCKHHWNTEQENYIVELHEVADKETDGKTLEQWAASRKLLGWKNDWILREACHRNPDNMKEAFMRVVAVLRTEDGGEKLSPKYWHFFKEHKLGKVKPKKDNGPKII